MRAHQISICAIALLLGAYGCSDASDAADEAPAALAGDEGGASDNGDAGASPTDTESDGGDSAHGGDAGGKADAHVDAGPSCAKHITVLFSVGTGASALESHSNGCWTVINADGAANSKFRKCSTSNFHVGNPTAANYSYDDTNPTRSLSQDQTFLSQCSSGATGDGYEFLAYRGGSWRLLGAPHLKAYFAELYGSDPSDVDSFRTMSGVWTGNAQLAAHSGHVYPMINIGPPASAHLENHIGASTLALCKKIDDQGYFGTYVATWPSGLAANDPRTLAVANALDKCTAAP